MQCSCHIYVSIDVLMSYCGYDKSHNRATFLDIHFLPLFLDSFLPLGIRSVTLYYSMRWCTPSGKFFFWLLFAITSHVPTPPTLARVVCVLICMFKKHVWCLISALSPMFEPQTIAGLVRHRSLYLSESYKHQRIYIDNGGSIFVHTIHTHTHTHTHTFENMK